MQRKDVFGICQGILCCVLAGWKASEHTNQREGPSRGKTQVRLTHNNCINPLPKTEPLEPRHLLKVPPLTKLTAAVGFTLSHVCAQNNSWKLLWRVESGASRVACQVTSLDQHPPWWIFRSLSLIFETVCYRVTGAQASLPHKGPTHL